MFSKNSNHNNRSNNNSYNNSYNSGHDDGIEKYLKNTSTEYNNNNIQQSRKRTPFDNNYTNINRNIELLYRNVELLNRRMDSIDTQLSSVIEYQEIQMNNIQALADMIKKMNNNDKKSDVNKVHRQQPKYKPLATPVRIIKEKEEKDKSNSSGQIKVDGNAINADPLNADPLKDAISSIISKLNSGGDLLDGSMIIHVEDISPDMLSSRNSENKSKNPSFPTIGPLGMFGSLSSILGKQGQKRNKNNEQEVEEDIKDNDYMVYNSDDEVEDMNLDIKNIDDMLNLADYCENLKGSTDQKTDGDSNKSINKSDKSDNDNNSSHKSNKQEKSEKPEKIDNNVDKHIKKNNDSCVESKTQQISSDKKDNKEKEQDNLTNAGIYVSPPIYIRNPVDTSTIIRNLGPGDIKGYVESLFKRGKRDNIEPQRTAGCCNRKKLIPEPVDHIVAKPETVNNTSLFELNGKKYSIDFDKIIKLRKPLTKLKNMIGLEQVKVAIVDMILYYMQYLEKNNNDMLHCIIEGPPGVGKTELGKILAEVFASLGIIKSNKFKMVKRTDLIGEYLGHTAHRTQEAIDEADGGVLFLDEAYSLGNEEKRDSFAKECIDVLNQNLSENRRKLICIIAGYPDELDKCFFSYNRGLARRFPFRFKIDGYKPAELRDIFIKKVNDIKYTLDKDNLNIDQLTKLFVENIDQFTNYGGDIDNFLTNCKFMQSRRIFGKHPKNRRRFTNDDIKKGLDRFITNKSKEAKSASIQNMYS